MAGEIVPETCHRSEVRPWLSFKDEQPVAAIDSHADAHPPPIVKAPSDFYNEILRRGCSIREIWGVDFCVLVKKSN
jgi:hypothetical protein